MIDPNAEVTSSFIKQDGLDSDEERTYEPISTLPDLGEEIAIEEAFNPVDMGTAASAASKAKGGLSSK